MIQQWITEKKFKNLMIPNESPQNEDDEEMTHAMLRMKEGLSSFHLKKEAGADE